MIDTFKSFVSDESGATAIEYGLIAAIIAIGLISALSGIRDALNNKFNAVKNAVTTAKEAG